MDGPAEAEKLRGLDKKRFMIAIDNTTAPAGKFAVPWNITEWLDQPGLLAGVAQDIDSLDWANPELAAFLGANPRHQPRFLLTLLTCAYATGVCESKEVCEMYFRDGALKNLFPGQAPTASAITRFRRENRGLLKWAVAQAFKRALRARFELGDGPIPAGLRRVLADAASMRLDAGRHLDRGEAGE